MVMWAAVAWGWASLDSTWLVIVLDVFEGPHTPCCTTTTTTLTDSTQQQRMTQNGHNHFCNKSENFWMTRKQREGGGALFMGHTVAGLCCWSKSDQSNCDLISHRMRRQSSAGQRSKWELVHYGSASRYFTNDSDIGEGEEVIVTD